jgi:hypothetical protein
MLAQLKQVAITYVTRPRPFQWFALVFLALPWIFISRLDDPGDRSPTPIIATVFVALMSAGLFKDQLSWQCAHPRSALMPDFRRPHLIVTWSLTILIAVLFPMALYHSPTCSTWTLLFASALGVLVTRLSFASYILLAPLYALFIYGGKDIEKADVADWLNAVGYRYPLMIAFTLIAWAFVVVRDLAFIRQREDDRTYKTPVVGKTRRERLSRTFRMQRERAASTELAHQIDRSWWASSLIDRKISAAPRMATWQKLDLVFTEPKPPLVRFGSLAFVVFLWGANFVNMLRRGDAWDAEELPKMSFYAAFILAACVVVPAMPLTKRLTQMNVERLLPLSNQAYADSLLVVFLWRSAKLWLLLQGLVAAVVFALPWQGLNPIKPADVTGYLAMSLAGLICSCGVCFLFSLFHDLLALLFAAAIIAGATLGLQTYWAHLRAHESQDAAFVWAFIFTAIGVGCALIGRIEWRDKEYAAALSDRFS